jgi:hypothetical protein
VETTSISIVSRQKRSGLRYDLFSTGVFHTNHSYVGDCDHGHCISASSNLYVTCDATEDRCCQTVFFYHAKVWSGGGR